MIFVKKRGDFIATAVVEANHTVVVPMFNVGERVTVFTDIELEKKLHNAAYFAELSERIKDADAGKLVRHELIEVDDMTDRSELEIRKCQDHYNDH